MHVYFVRHGETVLNRKNVHQSPSTPLSPEGREQALTVAEALRGMNPDLLLTSGYTRARETAGTIGLCTGLVSTISGLFCEIVRPSSLYGKSHFHPSTLTYVLLSILNKDNVSWRYEDAENFNDISTRAKSALAHLESLHGTHESVIVVSHTVFINIMVSYLCNDRMLAVRDLLPIFLHVKRMKNTDIIHLEYAPSVGSNTCSWIEKGKI